MAEHSPKGWKTLVKKEEVLVMSNFSFSHNVFKRLVLLEKREIAHCEPFVVFLQCFQKTCATDSLKRACLGKG